MNEALLAIPPLVVIMILGWNGYIHVRQDKAEKRIQRLDTNVTIIKKDVKALLFDRGLPTENDE